VDSTRARLSVREYKIQERSRSATESRPLPQPRRCSRTRPLASALPNPNRLGITVELWDWVCGPIQAINAESRAITSPGPGEIELELNLVDDLALSNKETRTLTAALNSFNVLNHVNDMSYMGVITSPFYGRAAALPPRRMQLDVQFKF
jgi:hypothetical protein